jgi:hypothetical protein
MMMMMIQSINDATYDDDDTIRLLMIIMQLMSMMMLMMMSMIAMYTRTTLKGPLSRNLFQRTTSLDIEIHDLRLGRGKGWNPWRQQACTSWVA